MIRITKRSKTEIRAHTQNCRPAAPAAAERVAWLAGRVKEGEASVEDRAEYESCVMFASFLGVLQSKARRKFQAAS